MTSPKDRPCDRMAETVRQIGGAMMQLHGREVYNAYGLYGQELRQDIYELISQHFMTPDLQPSVVAETVLLPAITMRNTKRMRALWDVFIFIYMSHKIQNIKSRDLASRRMDVPSILYLRGADYQLAVSHKGAAVGHNTIEDINFNFNVLHEIKDEFNIVKALSPSDLSHALRLINAYRMENQESRLTISEFARQFTEGLFLSPRDWKERVQALFPPTSIFLVYVSNQSNGLNYELESLLAHGLEQNAILVLDDRRFGSRQSFFALQDRLKEMGQEMYLSVDREACAVEDPDAFEKLVLRFPHAVALTDDAESVVEAIKRLAPMAARPDVAAPEEVAFEFEVPLDTAAAEQVASLRKSVGDFIEGQLSQETVANWPVLLLYVELDILLSLAFGDIVKAAISTTRYGAMADFMRAFLAKHARRLSIEFDTELKQCGNLAVNVAAQAFGLGEWNDYSDRRVLAKQQIDAAMNHVMDLMHRSVESAEKKMVRKAEKRSPSSIPSDYVDLRRILTDAIWAVNKKSED